jgi:hypothetical protein
MSCRQAQSLREEGDRSFQKEHWGEAHAAYTEALAALSQPAGPRTPEGRALECGVLQKRAGCCLQMGLFDKCIGVSAGWPDGCDAACCGSSRCRTALCPPHDILRGANLTTPT